MISLEELRDCKNLERECVELKQQITSLYTPIRSPVSGTGGHSSEPSDPTASTVAKIAEIKEILAKKETALLDRLIAIEKWLDEVESAEIRAIVRCHFIRGLTWRETAKELYGSYIEDSAPRKKFYRYYYRQKCPTMSSAPMR